MRQEADVEVIKPRSLAVFCGFTLLGAAMFFLTLSGAAGAGEIDRKGYTSSEVCSYCHVDIYNSWKHSLHALAYDNPIFMTAYRHAYLETKGEAKEYCLKCHTPTIYDTGDTDVELPLTREGITCDFCHTVEDVDLSNIKEPFKLDVGGEKRAAMRQFKRPYVDTPGAHVATYTKWFNKSELCAPCHELTNLKGLKTGATYTEWKGSKYAEAGVQCQDCHMSPVPGKPVDPSVKTPKANTIPDHSLSHNLEQMQEAVDLNILKAERTMGGRYMVEVAMTNTKAGHNIPTGAPARRLHVEVTLRGEGTGEVTQLQTFGKRILDENGQWLQTDVEAFLHGVKMEENTALKPKETRVIRFMFGAPPAGDVKVSARAFLVYRSVVTTEEATHIPMGEVSKR